MHNNSNVEGNKDYSNDFGSSYLFWIIKKEKEKKKKKKEKRKKKKKKKEDEQLCNRMKFYTLELFFYFSICIFCFKKLESNRLTKTLLQREIEVPERIFSIN